MSGFCPRFFVDQPGAASPGSAALGGASPGAVAPGAVPAGSRAEFSQDLSGTEWILNDKDSHHALRVLRLVPGDRCEVVVGAAVYAATVGSGASPVTLKLTSRLEGDAAGGGYRVQVGLVQAMTRPALLDQVLEKATEVGASFFMLVPTAGSPRRSDQSHPDRLERRRRIVLEAAKQSKRIDVPPVEVAESAEQTLQVLAGRDVFSLALEPTAKAGLWECLGPEGPRNAAPVDSAPVGSRRAGGGGLALWVGPEGGWSAAELEWFGTAGVEAVRLGRSILRAETAGPVAVAAARLLLRDW